MKITENAKKTFCLILSLIICICYLASPVRAESSECWYLKRGKKGEPPSFPTSASTVSENGGIYIDNTASKEGRHVLYLTFDAGYENGNIESILDTMKEKGVCGAFFILGHLVADNPELIKRMNEEGHLVCNHTKNHKDLSTLTDTEVEANLKALEDACKEQTGVEMTKFFRFPEGKYSLDKLRLVGELGYTTVFWSIAYADWDNAKQPNEEAAFNKVMSQTHDGAIILLHPTSRTNAKILGRLIDTWRKMGYEFGSLADISV